MSRVDISRDINSMALHVITIYFPGKMIEKIYIIYESSHSKINLCINFRTSEIELNIGLFKLPPFIAIDIDLSNFLLSTIVYITVSFCNVYTTIYVFSSTNRENVRQIDDYICLGIL